MTIRNFPAQSKPSSTIHAFCEHFVAETVAVYDSYDSERNKNRSIKIRTSCSVDGATYEVLLQDESLFKYKRELEESLTEAGFYSASVVLARRQTA